jgi:hypothetical protein
VIIAIASQRQSQMCLWCSFNFDSIVDEAEDQRVLALGTARKKQRLARDKPRALLPCNLHAIMLMDKHIPKVLHGHDYDRNLSLRVVGAGVCMQQIGHLQKVAKLGKVVSL